MGLIKRQALKNTATTYLGIGLGMLNLMVIQPKFLTSEEIGLTRLLFSIASLLAVFVPFGVTQLTQKYFPVFRNEEKRHHGFWGFMLLFPLIGFAVCSLFLWLGKPFIVQQYQAESALFNEFYNFLFPFTFFLALITSLNSYAFALYKSTVPSFLNDVVSRILNMIAFALYFIKVITLEEMVALFISFYGLQLVLLFIYIAIEDRLGWKPNWSFIRQQRFSTLLVYSGLLTFGSVASLGLRYIDAIVVGKYLPLSLLGIYAIASFVPNIIEAPMNAIDRIASSKMAAALAANNRKEMHSIYTKSTQITSVVGGLFFLGITISINEVLTFLPADYSQGNWVIVIICVGTLINTTSSSSAPILFNSSKYKQGVVLLISVAFLSFLLNLMLIPLWGLNGAAMATGISLVVYGLTRVLLVYKHHNLWPYTKQTGYLALVIVLLFPLYFISFTQMASVDILIKSTIVTLVYGIIVLKMGMLHDLYDIIPNQKIRDVLKKYGN